MKKLALILCTFFLVAGCNGKSGPYYNFSSDGMRHSVAPGSHADLEMNVGDRVYFGFDTSALSADAQATLTRQIAWMKEFPKNNVTIEGHCDERGTREYNLALGERRATAVKNFLVSGGISPSRISTISYGKERPAVVGTGEEVHRLNRRGVTVCNH